MNSTYPDLAAEKQEEKSYRERIDPGGKDAQQIAGLEALTSLAPVKWLLKRNGGVPSSG